MHKANLATSLRRRTRSNPMRAYDALPPDLRHWLAQAALPWSPQSVAQLWRKAMREAGGDRDLAFGRLNAAEQKLLRRDGARIWGADLTR